MFMVERLGLGFTPLSSPVWSPALVPG